MLRDEADVEVVRECNNGAEATEAINKLRPDLLFLDVQMPGMDGFEVLRQSDKEHLPIVIFVTAYDRHAVKAFEVHALDYLLKPFKPARFQGTLQRVRELLGNKESGAISKGLLEMLDQIKPERVFLARIAVKNGDRTMFVKTAEIDYLESAGNYIVVHAGKENHVVRETLTALEEQLDPKKFVRISRSMLVNVEQIKELLPLFKSEHVVVLRNGKQLPMTRGVRELEELLKFS